MSTKITELTQLVGTPSDTDVILITDVSEDASKQITVADLLSGTSEVGSFVFDSATINTTGNANVTFNPDVSFTGDLSISTLVSTGTGPFNLNSASSINFTATDAVTANGVPLPTYGGMLKLNGTNAPTWTGSAGITATRQSSGNFRLTFPSAFTSIEDYAVMVTFQDYHSGVYVPVNRSTGYVDFGTVYREGDGSVVEQGTVSVLVYEF
jgi:hypothetical protein